MTPEEAATAPVEALAALTDAEWSAAYHRAAEGMAWAAVDALEAEGDRRWPRTPLIEPRLTAPGALRSAARWYAAHGVPVFPLTPGEKVPLPGSRGFKDASTDPAVVEAWWARTPEANIGAATGHVFDVLDVDGHAAWAALKDVELALLGRSRTARPGGWHLFIPPTGGGNRARIDGAPLDLRGRGGYVLLPPSRVDGHFYRWIDPLELP